jgi:hypothetical protein
VAPVVVVLAGEADDGGVVLEVVAVAPGVGVVPVVVAGTAAVAW